MDDQSSTRISYHNCLYVYILVGRRRRGKNLYLNKPTYTPHSQVTLTQCFSLRLRAFFQPTTWTAAGMGLQPGCASVGVQTSNHPGCLCQARESSLSTPRKSPYLRYLLDTKRFHCHGNRIRSRHLFMVSEI